MTNHIFAGYFWCLFDDL